MGSFITLAKKDRGSVAFRCKPSFYSMETRTETMVAFYSYKLV